MVKKTVAVGGTPTATATGDDLGGRVLSSVEQDSTKPPVWQESITTTSDRLDDFPLVVRDRRANRRYFIDNSFVRGGWAAAVGPFGIAAYNALALHADVDSQDAWPSYATIANLTGMSRAKAIDAVEELAAWGLIHVETRQDARLYKSNVATLLDASQWRQQIAYVRGRDGRQIEKTLTTPLVYHVHQGSVPDIPPPSVPGTPKQDSDILTKQRGQDPSSASECDDPGKDDVALTGIVQTDDDDDDGSPFSIPEPEFPPEPEIKEITNRDAALRLLAEVAPNFDQVATWVETQDVVKVGLIAASLVADPDKLDRLTNPAGYIRKTALNGFQPDDATKTIWRRALAGEDLDDPVVVETEPGRATWMTGTIDGSALFDAMDAADAAKERAIAIWHKSRSLLILSGVPDRIVNGLQPYEFKEGVLMLGSKDDSILESCQVRWSKLFVDVLCHDPIRGLVFTTYYGTPGKEFLAVQAPVETPVATWVDPDAYTIPEVAPKVAIWRQLLDNLRPRMLTFDLDIVQTLTPLAFDEKTRELCLSVPDERTLALIQNPRLDDKIRQALDDVTIKYLVRPNLSGR